MLKVNPVERLNIQKGRSERYFEVTDGNFKFWLDRQELNELHFLLNLQLIIERDLEGAIND